MSKELFMQIGWTEEGAEMLMQHKDDPAVIGLLRRLGQKIITPRIKTKKQPIPAHIRWNVWERDNFTCKHCGKRQYLEVDHIHPESKGGTLALDNLQTLCRTCNVRKGAR